MKMATSEHPSNHPCSDCARTGLSRCSYVLHDSNNFLECGCEVIDRFARVTMEPPNYGLIFKSRCVSHRPKEDSRKADSTTAYAFTLTMPPDYKHTKAIEECARLICENGMTSKPYEKPVQWAYVLEHTEAGTPHIHGTYKMASGRRIEQKYFKRYWPLWSEKDKIGLGHVGGYHQKARHAESYDAYIQKEGVVYRNRSKSPEPDLISHS